jgi:magnesium-transporting ATPase (P-type)
MIDIENIEKDKLLDNHHHHHKQESEREEEVEEFTNGTSAKITGLTHKESLKILYDQIDNELSEFHSKKMKFRFLLNDFFQSNLLEFIHNFLAICLCSLFLFITLNKAFFSDAITLLIIAILNLIIIVWIYFKTTLIIYNKARTLLVLIDNCLKFNKKLNINEFTCHSNLPINESVSNQLVFRDNRLINLPLSLIVKNDIIMIKPGETIKVKCRSLNNSNNKNKDELFEQDSIYKPVNRTTKQRLKQKNPCKFKDTSQPIVCITLETPYLQYLRSVLKNYNCYSDTIITNEIKKCRKIILTIILPLILVTPFY